MPNVDPRPQLEGILAGLRVLLVGWSCLLAVWIAYGVFVLRVFD